MQQLFLHEHGTYQPGIEMQMPPILHSKSKMPRIQVLYNQEAWVAQDEMDFYLHMINTTGLIQVAPVGVIPEFFEDDELDRILHDWFSFLMPPHDHAGKTISALYVAHHWFPVIVTPRAGSILIQTTPGGMAWVEIAVRTQGIEYSIQPVSGAILNTFHNDCGFQAVAWLTDAVFNPCFGDPLQRASPMDVKAAIAWRCIFEQHLFNCQLAQIAVVPADMAFGGAGAPDLTKQVIDLLTNRGVPPEQAAGRAEAVIEKLGRQPITRAMRAANPWRELKQLANLATPKIQLVLASEMQAAIQTRIASGQPFGDKKKKIPHEKKPKRDVLLDVEDVTIPDGIFRDANNVQLSQIPFQSIGPEARGLVVVSAEQAVPYLRFSQPVSKHGLALIVINCHSPLIHGAGEEIRFPARCERTAEPILLTARIIQLGNIEVTRATPSNITKVDEVNTVVVRVCTYRDELQSLSWETFCAKPVKQLVDDIGLFQPNSQGVSPIIDIWDRQWLTEKLERTTPSEAAFFCACFRVETSDLLSVLQHQGKVAHYIEPRSLDGRAPHSDFRVIWINKKNRQAVVLASQSTAQWNSIVRTGNRFGLRAKATDAKEIHEQHKPQTPYLESDEILTFHAGPFPHGSNRGALVKLFAAWGWPARPAQPKTRTPNGQGVIWEVQAAARPQFEVYQLAHADILITEISKRPSKTSSGSNDVQGSAKTLAALTREAAVAPNQDPWKDQDPWSGYQPPSKISRMSASQELRGEDIDAIAARVQQKIHHRPQHAKPFPADDDAAMQVDDRMGQMEEKLLKLENTMHEQHRQQTHVTNELSTQIAAVQHQTQAIHSHIDQKMQEQLNNIERLLSKRRAE